MKKLLPLTSFIAIAVFLSGCLTSRQTSDYEPETDFSSYNDIFPHYHVLPNQVYYLKRKMIKAKIYYHTVRPNETLWSVSQEYGVRLEKIKKMNRMGEEENKLEIGRVLWLKKVRPKNHPIEYK